MASIIWCRLPYWSVATTRSIISPHDPNSNDSRKVIVAVAKVLGKDPPKEEKKEEKKRASMQNRRSCKN